jgi:putative membrane protein
MRGRALAVAAAVVLATVGVAGAAPRPELSPFDRHFLIAAAESNTFELATATSAQSRGQTRGVCDLAARLIADHKRAAAEMAGLVARVGVKVPKRLNPLQQWALRQTGTFPVGTGTPGGGTRLEEGFPDLQAAAHRLVIRDFAEAARVAENAQVRAFAKRMLPVLRRHLEQAVETADEAGGALARCER